MKNNLRTLLCTVLLQLTASSYADDSITLKSIGMDLARDIVNESVQACRKAGFQVSAVIVDRNGIVKAILRDDLASRFTLQIAEEKANSVILSGLNSGEFRKNRSDIRAELNHMDDLIIMQGALPIIMAGSRVGAIGVSGAPGGDIDERCAQQALDKLQERLDFSD